MNAQVVQATAQVQTELCPWCGSIISRERFDDIQNRIRAEEEQKRRQFEADLTGRLQQQHALDVQRARESALQSSNAEWTKKLAALESERDQATANLKAVEAQGATLRQQLVEETQKAADLRIREAQEEQQKQFVELRAVIEKERDDAVTKKQSEFAREKEALEKKVLEMGRQLNSMTANQIGDGAEIDLFENLKQAFRDDRITRVPKGTLGPDIKHEVVYHGQSCGLIIYDSKNRQKWEHSYATKLREDQVRAEAEHALLCTTFFPSGKKELCVESGVIVVSPARATHLVSILRQAMIKMQILGLSMKERQKKTDKLYKFITSDEYIRCFRHAVQLNEQMLNLDVQEKRAHDLLWKKRGELLKRQGNVLGQIETEIASIIEAADQG